MFGLVSCVPDILKGLSIIFRSHIAVHQRLYIFLGDLRKFTVHSGLEPCAGTGYFVQFVRNQLSISADIRRHFGDGVSTERTLGIHCIITGVGNEIFQPAIGGFIIFAAA